MTLLCPLSGSQKVILLEKISKDTLAKMYKKMLKDSILSEFNSIKEIGFYHCSESDLKFFYPMVTGSELFYEKLQNFDWYYLDEKEEYEYASSYIKPSDKVLEIGCGKGVFSEKITAQEYTGLEFSQKAQTWASQNNLKVLNESIEQHSLNNTEKYSVVCSFQVLEHIAEIHSFIEASIKCLKPGGLLIYSVPSADSFIASVKNNILNMPPHHISWWSDKSLQHIAHIFGLKVIDIHHEKLAEIHRRWYVSSILLEALANSISYRSNNLLIDQSFTYKIMSKSANLGSKWLEKGFLDNKVLPNGHSVTGIYQKPKI
ncbi:MAG: class I SAM-dependent methyltransferase [Xenococcus sp. (in: cyanobacteria)]